MGAMPLMGAVSLLEGVQHESAIAPTSGENITRLSMRTNSGGPSGSILRTSSEIQPGLQRRFGFSNPLGSSMQFIMTGVDIRECDPSSTESSTALVGDYRPSCYSGHEVGKNYGGPIVEDSSSSDEQASSSTNSSRRDGASHRFNRIVPPNTEPIPVHRFPCVTGGSSSSRKSLGYSPRISIPPSESCGLLSSDSIEDRIDEDIRQARESSHRLYNALGIEQKQIQLTVQKSDLESLSLRYAPQFGTNDAPIITENVPVYGDLTLRELIGQGEASTVYTVTERDDLVIKYQSDCPKSLNAQFHPLILDYFFLKKIEDLDITPRVDFISPLSFLPSERGRKCAFGMNEGQFDRCIEHATGTVRYMVMEKTGPTIASIMRRYEGQEVPFRGVLRLGISLMKNLKKLHQDGGIVHGDIHIGNVVLRNRSPITGGVARSDISPPDNHSVLLIDFGRSFPIGPMTTSRVASSSSLSSCCGSLVGDGASSSGAAFSTPQTETSPVGISPPGTSPTLNGLIGGGSSLYSVLGGGFALTAAATGSRKLSSTPPSAGFAGGGGGLTTGGGSGSPPLRVWPGFETIHHQMSPWEIAGFRQSARDDVFRAYLMICMMISGEDMIRYLKWIDREKMIREGYRFKMYDNMLIIPRATSRVDSASSRVDSATSKGDATTSMGDESMSRNVLLEKQKSGRLTVEEYGGIMGSFTRISSHIRLLEIDELADYDYMIAELEYIQGVYKGERDVRDVPR